MTPDPSRNTRLAQTFAYYGAFIAIGLTSASLGPTLPDLTLQTGSLLNEISTLFTARAFGYLLGSLAGGRLYDRLPGHRVMAGMLLLMGATLGLVPFLPLLWLLTLDMFLVGFGEGSVDVGGNTLLVWVHRDHVGPYMNGLHFFFGVGAFLSPLIIAQVLLHTTGIAWAYWILALAVLPVAAWLLRQPSPPAQHAGTDQASRGKQPGLVLLVVLFLMLYVGGEVGFGGWIATYALEMNLADKAQAAYLTSVFWGALTAGRLLGIPIAARLRPRWILLIDLLGSLASLGVILLWRDSLLAVQIGAAGYGLAMASVFPTTINLAERRMPITGQVTSFFLVGASAGGMSLPWLIGQAFEPFGPPAAMVLMAIYLLLALGVYGLLMAWKPAQAP